MEGRHVGLDFYDLLIEGDCAQIPPEQRFWSLLQHPPCLS